MSTHQLKMRYGVKTRQGGRDLYLCKDATLGNKKEGARYDSLTLANKALEAYVQLCQPRTKFEVCAMEAG